MTTIKVREDDDEFHFGPNAIIFVQTPNKQIQITFNEEGGANIVQFEPVGADISFSYTDAKYVHSAQSVTLKQ